MISTFCSSVSPKPLVSSSYSCRNSGRTSCSLPEKCGAWEERAEGMAAGPGVWDMLETGGGKGEHGRLGGRGAEQGGTLGAGGRGKEE